MRRIMVLPLCLGLLILCACGMPEAEEPAVTAATTTDMDIIVTTTTAATTAIHVPPEAEPLKAALEAAMPNPLVLFEYDDFDGDGKKEAFGVCAGHNDNELDADSPYYWDCQIWYADSKGTTFVMGDEGNNEWALYGIPWDVVPVGKQKLFSWMVHAFGSGSAHLFFGVRDGKPYELEISGKYYQLDEHDGEFSAVKGDFSGGWHDHAVFFFRFDEKSGEFVPAQPKHPRPVKEIQISIDPEELPIKVGDTYMLDKRVIPEDAYNRTVEWTSDNPDVIDDPGAYITAKAPGTATITARSTDGSNVSASIEITVVE